MIRGDQLLCSETMHAFLDKALPEQNGHSTNKHHAHAYAPAKNSKWLAALFNAFCTSVHQLTLDAPKEHLAASNTPRTTTPFLHMFISWVACRSGIVYNDAAHCCFHASTGFRVTAWSLVLGFISPMEISGRTGGCLGGIRERFVCFGEV